MLTVLITALVVGGATVLGAVLGLLFRRLSPGLTQHVLAASTGIMLAAAILGLIVPSLDYGGRYSYLITVAGIFSGAAVIHGMEGFLPRLRVLVGIPRDRDDQDNMLLFVAAILIHKLPEGIAAGVGFGTDSTLDALLIAGGIALQNIPEGMIVAVPMLRAGVSVPRTMLCGIVTALAELLGTLAGYWAVTVAAALLPFGLAFAGGTMLYVILGQLRDSRLDYAGTCSVLAGFSAMLVCYRLPEI